MFITVFSLLVLLLHLLLAGAIGLTHRERGSFVDSAGGPGDATGGAWAFRRVAPLQHCCIILFTTTEWFLLVVDYDVVVVVS